MPIKIALRVALIMLMTLFSSKAWGGELRDAPFWASLQSLNTLVPEHLTNKEIGVILVDVATPRFSWFPLLKRRERHAVLWFKVSHETHLYGGLFLTVVDTAGNPFFFPVDPTISLSYIGIDEVVRAVDVLETIDGFIQNFCVQ